MSETKEKKHFIGDHYYYTDNGTLYYCEPIIKDGETVGTTETAIANHTPILKEQRVIDNGIETNEELVFNVLRDFHRGIDTAVTLKEILGQTPQAKFGAACRIFLGRGAKSRYSEAMQIQCENAPCSTLYQHTGYTVIDGERVFLNGGNSVTAEGMTDKYNVVFGGQQTGLSNYGFTEERNTERYNTLLKLLPGTTTPEVLFPSYGLVFLTPLNAVLRELGIEPRFILYFTGKTGSGKSSWAALMLNFFGRFAYTEKTLHFRDTVNAIEKVFALTDSTLVLLDDRIPSTTAKVRVQMESIEQAVARQIGDRSGRARMNADGSLKAVYRPKCNVIITAEDSFSNVGESAIARSISVSLKPGIIDIDALIGVYKNASHLNECMGDYIQYILKNWDNLQEKLKPMFYEFREKAQNNGHGRLVDCVAHLQIGISIFCEWLLSVGVIDQNAADNIKSRSWSVYMELAEQQNKRIADEKPVKLFLDALKEMLDRGTVRFMGVDDNSGFTSEKVIGFKDDEFYYCYPDSIYSEVRKFYAAQDKSFPLGKSALFQQLETDALIEAGNGQTTKLKRIQGKRSRFLWLRAAALDAEEVTDE